ncbi:ATP-binding protein [Erythrobacter sp.]|uniref:sensor histidine kinase n=1 Tax=Erythrobacter sp. TaxID=1042 RepID=UPI001B279B0C|nr:ATP-binding protein [Erythrobacter sp.]MBO6526061.1 HAMP domain-containing protein [Erythrobacter sp.]MBO6531135.1 HAMP domain-containing protein [Erythrobacter sp.]
MATSVAGTRRQTPRWWRRFVVTARRQNIFAYIEALAAIAFLVMVASTWATFTNAPPNGALLPSRQVAGLLIGTLVPAMALLVLAGRRIALRRAAGSTARLHVRLVFFFSMIAAVPTLLVAGFAAFLFQSGVDFWFSDDSRGLMENANQLAEGYYEENQLDLANETISMAMDMRAILGRVQVTDPNFALVYQYQAEPRDVIESAILQAMPDATMRTAVVYGLNEESDPRAFAQDSLAQLSGGAQVAVRGSPERIEAVAPIDREAGIYLYTARNAEAGTFRSWQSARSISTAYDELTKRARALQLRFNLALFFVSLALVGLAVWFALRFADRQVEPLTDLVAAADKVGAGNFALRVEGRTGADEIGLLNRAFNRMTAQLEKQTDALLSANTELEERRSFIEAVLESVSAGVISVDSDLNILLMNAPAQSMLGQDTGVKSPPGTLDELAPQIGVMVKAGLTQGVVSHNRNGELLTLAVKIGRESDGHVITFEDITRQLLDQRQAAWSDVARRIAHEIKNPLTPIQLATERLKRRYRKQIESDGELFDELTSTIVRQVGDLRKMVDEFSSFARLPKPSFRPEDALDLVRQSLFLQEVAHPEIDYRLIAADGGPIRIQCDRHQLGQALTNTLKNAYEAIETKAQSADVDYRGKILVEVQSDDEALAVSVQDNGIGLPQDRENILDPYVTTREKGTGLGLAIVNKIVEEHGGEMTFTSVDTGGTRVTMRFARDPLASVGDTQASMRREG